MFFLPTGEQLLTPRGAALPPRSPAHHGPLQLLSHPQNIGDRRVVQGQNQDVRGVRETFHQAGQGRLGAPQDLQEGGLVGEGVDEQRPLQGSGLVGELPVQSRDRERGRGVARLRAGSRLRTGGFSGVVIRDPGGLVFFGQCDPSPLRYLPFFCPNNEEEHEQRRQKLHFPTAEWRH